jgi:hypothetical protein
MTERTQLSTRTRFEIFKRDGFKCVYCGRTPMESPLHVDHVEPIARGGTSDPSNLVTACASCNLGKSDVPLADRALEPSMSPESVLEHAEQIKAYLAAQRVLVKAKSAVADEVLVYWVERVGDHIPRDLPPRIPRMLEEWGLAKLCEAIDIVGSKWNGYGGSRPLKYLHGILRRWREERGGVPVEAEAQDGEEAEEPSTPPVEALPVVDVRAPTASPGPHVECPACGNSGPASEVYEHAGRGKDPRCRRCKRWRWPQFTGGR